LNLIEGVGPVRARSLILPDHGNGRFSPVYIDDLLDGTLLAATRPEGAGHVFTIAGGYSVPAKEFFGYHWRWAGRKGDVPGVSLAPTRTIELGLKTASIRAFGTTRPCTCNEGPAHASVVPAIIHCE